MGKTTGVIGLFNTFIEHLEQNRARLAPLQLSGRIEDYLVHEFIYHIYQASEGERFSITNAGSKGEQKFDVSILAVQPPDEITIVAFAEAKFLRNRHRFWEFSAEDEVSTALRSLQSQLGRFKEERHSLYDVELSSRRDDVYGLVFGSYVLDENNPLGTDKEEFFSKCLAKAESLGLRFHDLPKPYWRPAYEDEAVNILSSTFYCSLRAGLWRLVTNDEQ